MTRNSAQRLRTAVYNLASLSVPCVDCGAGAGRPCVSYGPRATLPGTAVEWFHTPRRASAAGAAKMALDERGDQRCPHCGETVGVPSHDQGWHQCKRSPQLAWVRVELTRLRNLIIEAVGEKRAVELFSEEPKCSS